MVKESTLEENWLTDFVVDSYFELLKNAVKSQMWKLSSERNLKKASR